jgi:DNA repair protein RecO (recombination protein O)
MRTFKSEGIIIRRRNFKDADRIITIMTRYHGKIAVRGSGIRRIPSKRSPHVELLNHCTVTLYKGNSFPILTEAQTIDSFSYIKTNLELVGLAYHLCELVDGLCPEDQENPGVFLLLKNTLARLCLSEDIDPHHIKDTIRDFEVSLLSQLGYWNKDDAITENIDMNAFIENIMERKLKSKQIFSKIV